MILEKLGPLGESSEGIKVVKSGKVGKKKWRVGPLLFAEEDEVPFRGTLYVSPAAITMGQEVGFSNVL